MAGKTDTSSVKRSHGTNIQGETPNLLNIEFLCVSVETFQFELVNRSMGPRVMRDFNRPHAPKTNYKTTTE